CEGRKRKYESYAGRFAAKEAVMKALGVGWGKRAGWLDIEVGSTGGGEPEINLYGKASLRAAHLGIRRFSLSLTHTELYAVAALVAEGDGEPLP
ncbi:MAG TPA: holo-ACP synthase, partial [Candidatus Binatia bacterium]